MQCRSWSSTSVAKTYVTNKRQGLSH